MWGDPFCKKGLPTPLPKNFHVMPHLSGPRWTRMRGNGLH